MRRFLATLFLIVLLAEWGAHTFNHHFPETPLSQTESSVRDDNSTISYDALSVLADHHTHDDAHCPTMICNDSKRHDHQVANAGHDVTPSNRIDNCLPDVRLVLAREGDPPLPFRIAHRLYGPPRSQFHPPELS